MYIIRRASISSGRYFKISFLCVLQEIIPLTIITCLRQRKHTLYIYRKTINIALHYESLVYFTMSCNQNPPINNRFESLVIAPFQQYHFISGIFRFKIYWVSYSESIQPIVYHTAILSEGNVFNKYSIISLTFSYLVGYLLIENKRS